VEYEGHRQIRRDVPSPLQQGSLFRRIGAFGLPAAMLSSVSMLAFLSALVLAQGSPELRADYTPAYVPAGLLFWVAFGTASLAWAIVLVGRRRPNGIWPRAWSLILAAVATLTALLIGAELLSPMRAQINAVLVACVAGTLALTPRLMRLVPSNPWSERIAPLTLVATLALVLPLTHAGKPAPGLTRADGPPVGPSDGTEAEVATVRSGASVVTADTRDAHERLLAATNYDWSRFGLDLGGARARVKQLRALEASFATLSEAWGSVPKAEQPGLFKAAGELMHGVSEAANPDRVQGVPSLAALGLGHKDFAEHVLVGADYYAALGELLQALTPTGSSSSALTQAAAEARETLAGNLKRVRGNWSDAWIAGLIPVGLVQDLGPRPAAEELLVAKLFSDEGRAYHANDIAALWSIDLQQARRLQAGGGNGCGGRAAQHKGQYRIDCYAFSVAAGTHAAGELAAELRVVYNTARESAPVELWYGLPIPHDPSPAEQRHWKDRMRSAFSSAVRQTGLQVQDSGNEARITDGGIGIGGRSWRVLTTEERGYYLDGRDWFIIRIVAG
jgi:hypothetical protein